MKCQKCGHDVFGSPGFDVDEYYYNEYIFNCCLCEATITGKSEARSGAAPRTNTGWKWFEYEGWYCQKCEKLREEDD